MTDHQPIYLLADSLETTQTARKTVRTLISLNFPFDFSQLSTSRIFLMIFFSILFDFLSENISTDTVIFYILLSLGLFTTFISSLCFLLYKWVQWPSKKCLKQLSFLFTDKHDSTALMTCLGVSDPKKFWSKLENYLVRKLVFKNSITRFVEHLRPIVLIQKLFFPPHRTFL